MGQAAQTQPAHADHGHGGSGGHGPHHEASYYVKIWALLLGLLIVSILGPMLGNKVLTIITAFGIAIVKALIVAAFFMHLNIEKRYIWYLLYAMLAMVTLFFFAVSPDIMKFQGRNWTKTMTTQYEENFRKAAAEPEGEAKVEGEAKAAGEPAPAGETAKP